VPAEPRSEVTARTEAPTSALPASSAPALAAAPATAMVVPVVADDRAAIERVLRAYQDSYDRLDAAAAALIWPKVDTRALARAFSTLSQQDMSFDRCTLKIDGVHATAECAGEIRYTRRTGDQTPRTRPLSWSIDLERTYERWQISSVSAQ
jgi:hypothetical protein